MEKLRCRLAASQKIELIRCETNALARARFRAGAGLRSYESQARLNRRRIEVISIAAPATIAPLGEAARRAKERIKPEYRRINRRFSHPTGTHRYAYVLRRESIRAARGQPNCFGRESG